MEFRKNATPLTNAETGSYAYYTFYNRTPSGYITLQQFEVYALERLKVLKAVELSNIIHTNDDTELKSQLGGLGWSFLFTGHINKTDEEKDFISHHILRLAYAKSFYMHSTLFLCYMILHGTKNSPDRKYMPPVSKKEIKRQWFVTQEGELMRLRISWNQRSISKILTQNQFDYQPVSSEEIQNLSDELNACRAGVAVTKTTYYKVCFEEVLQLVALRKIYLSRGYAYLPDTELLSFVINKYRMYLKEQLAVICKHLVGLEEENRVMKKLNALSSGDIGTGYKSTRAVGEAITADMLDNVLHNHLRSKHHLKHDGRMQLGLFLKGIGVSLEESLKFWRSEFGKGGIDSEKFDKNYAYNIRHNYGKEGKRTDYTPYSCMKVIGRADPKGDDCHGCPFKHNDASSLKSLLDKKRISAESIEDIMALKKQGHFQIACMSLFKATHPGGDGLVGGLQHPNQYFADSQAIINGDHDTKDSKKIIKKSEKLTVKAEADKENMSEIMEDDDMMDVAVE